MLPDVNRDLYHVAGDPHLAEALMTPKEATRAAAVAALERKAVIAGEYDGTGRAPSRAQLAAKHGISLENASVVLRMLAAEGWVTLEQGRGSFLVARRAFTAWVEIPLPEGGGRWDGHALGQSLDVAARGEPAAFSVRTARIDDDGAAVEVIVTAVSPAMAAAIAENLVRTAPGWSWDGWDLAGASVTARPAR